MLLLVRRQASVAPRLPHAHDCTCERGHIKQQFSHQELFEPSLYRDHAAPSSPDAARLGGVPRDTQLLTEGEAQQMARDNILQS